MFGSMSPLYRSILEVVRRFNGLRWRRRLSPEVRAELLCWDWGVVGGTRRPFRCRSRAAGIRRWRKHREHPRQKEPPGRCASVATKILLPLVGDYCGIKESLWAKVLLHLQIWSSASFFSDGEPFRCAMTSVSTQRARGNFAIFCFCGFSVYVGGHCCSVRILFGSFMYGCFVLFSLTYDECR